MCIRDSLNTYDWEGKDRDDIKGTKMGSEMLLTSNINFEIAYDDKDKKGLEAVSYTHLTLPTNREV